METLNVLSIDIGITNLGYVYAEMVIPKFKEKRLNYNVNIIDCNRIDITKVRHRRVKRCDCKLLHENCVPDYLDHFIQEHSFYFENANVIILERQPPVGITNVQDLLFTKFRQKVILISPNSVHKHFMLSCDYDKRKVQSEAIAMNFLKNFSNFTENFRKHDISDAMLMILFYYKQKNEDLPYEKIIVLDFDQFRL